MSPNCRHFSCVKNFKEVSALGKRIVILGGGTGGLVVANKLREALSEDIFWNLPKKGGEKILMSGIRQETAFDIGRLT